jgi:hypothetical protein
VNDWIGSEVDAGHNTPNSPFVSNVAHILNVVRITQPGTDWVKKQQIKITNGIVSVTFTLAPGPSDTLPGTGINIPAIGSPAERAANAVQPITNTLDFLNRLADAKLWIRVAEFAIGGILLAVGAAAMLKQSGK